MKERYLIVADSVAELILTIHVKLTILKDIDTTLILTDRTAGSENTAKRARELGLFDKVLYVKVRAGFPKTTERRHVPSFVRKMLYRIGCTKEAKAIIGEWQSYTGFMSSEVDFFSQFMYEAIRKKAKLYLIGELALTFAGLYEEMQIQRAKSVTHYFDEIQGIYYYGPMLRKTKLEKMMIPLPSINANRDDYVKVINHIFGYEPHKCIYKNKIIIFEESYSRDGGTDNLLEIVKKIADEFGTENVLVKRHPRDIENRFSEMNIYSVEPFSNPWELFILNDDCKDCILLAANSSSVYLTEIWDFNRQNNKCIMLRNVMDYSYHKCATLDEYFGFLPELYKKYNLVAPESMAKLIDTIREYRL